MWRATACCQFGLAMQVVCPVLAWGIATECEKPWPHSIIATRKVYMAPIPNNVARMIKKTPAWKNRVGSKWKSANSTINHLMSTSRGSALSLEWSNVAVGRELACEWIDDDLDSQRITAAKVHRNDVPIHTT